MSISLNVLYFKSMSYAGYKIIKITISFISGLVTVGDNKEKLKKFRKNNRNRFQ